MLAVPDEAALEAVSRKLTHAGVVHKRIVEPDAPFFGQLMAIGCVPGPKEVIGRPLRDLKLLR